MFHVTVTSPDLDKLIKGLQRFERKFIGTLNAADRTMRPMVVKAVQKSMAGHWTPNHPAWRKRKSEMGWATRPLFRTHLLHNSVSHQRITFSPALIKSQVGWHEGMRYGGKLREGIYLGRVPKQRKKYLGSAGSNFYKASHPETKDWWFGGGDYDTHHLAAVAGILEHGYVDGGRPFVKQATTDINLVVVKAFDQALAKALPVSSLQEAPF